MKIFKQIIKWIFWYLLPIWLLVIVAVSGWESFTNHNYATKGAEDWLIVFAVFTNLMSATLGVWFVKIGKKFIPKISKKDGGIHIHFPPELANKAKVKAKSIKTEYESKEVKNTPTEKIDKNNDMETSDEEVLCQSE